MYMVQQDIDQLMRNGLEQDRLEGLVEIVGHGDFPGFKARKLRVL